MLVQVNSGNGVRVQEDVAARIEALVDEALAHHADRITRVEVHLGDENSDKHGARDKRCMMEARIEGLKPIAVTDFADELTLAIEGAAEKLGRAVSHELGRLESRS